MLQCSFVIFLSFSRGCGVHWESLNVSVVSKVFLRPPFIFKGIHMRIRILDAIFELVETRRAMYTMFYHFLRIAMTAQRHFILC